MPTQFAQNQIKALDKKHHADESIGRASTQSVVNKIRESIFDGTYSYEDRLPAERQLAKLFNASRGTIRSALQQLEKQHLVVRKSGAGTFVCAASSSNQQEITKITSPLEVIEARIAIEPHLMRLVVANANRNDIEKLAVALQQVEQAGNDPESFTLADNRFHIALAECAQNKLMAWIYRQISKVREHSQWRSMKDKVLTPERIARYNKQHRALFEAISARHADEASKIMLAHLSGARNDLMGH